MGRLLAEALGTACLLATIIGSGIMGDRLSDGNVAVALLANALATGAILYVLITILGPVSGAHFNPAVSFAFWLRREMSARAMLAFWVVQIIAAIIGVWLAHLMFEEPILQLSSTNRTGPAQWVSEVVATFGLVFVILGGLRYRPDQVPMLVGLYITAGYWFTASTSFANPAVTIARSLSDTFAGIFPEHAPMFIAAQFVGALAAVALGRLMFGRPS